MAIFKPPMWEENKNTDTFVRWTFTEDIIYSVNNTPQDDDLVLRILDEPSPNKYDDDKYPEGDNNEYS